MTRKRWIISGRVQGVWFRDSTRKEAERIGEIRGFVRNLADGRVEVVAEATPDRLDRLTQFLRLGPPLARVTGIEDCSETPEGPLTDFRISS